MKKYLLIFMMISSFLSCTSLDEELEGTLTIEEASTAGNVEGLLTAAYSSLNPFGSQDRAWALAEHTSDEVAGPTRGPDWDDGGAWRQLHLHTWNTTSSFVINTWNGLLEGVFRSGLILQFNPNPEQEAEARFLRAFYNFWILDNWGHVFSREPNEDLTLPPSTSLERAEGIDFIISELEAALVNLPDNPARPGGATKNAARAMLMKAYLNKAVYKATGADGAAQKGPFTFNVTDMSTVIGYANDIINSGQYRLDDDYFDAFRPDNSSLSSENIFFVSTTRGSNTSNNQSRWFMTLHYNQTPGGWNGFVALSDLYDSFEDTDIRRGLPHIDFPEMDGKTGVDVGFLIGQQYDKDSVALKTRPGAPLVFTKNFSLTASDEAMGLRVVKYPIDFENFNNPENDYALIRFADVLLMKAEAILRGGTDSQGQSALAIVNDLRTVRGASALGSLDLTELLKERSRELYWEGWRRNDQIRFGTYLNAFQQKPVSTEKFLLFPIPPDVLSVSPNLKQNPGY